MNALQRLFLPALLLVSAPHISRGAGPVQLESGGLSVLLDPAFPRVVEYRLPGGATLAGQAAPVSAVEINGQPAPCTVTFRTKGRDAAEYRLDFAALKVQADLRVTVGDRNVEWRFVNLREAGDAKVRTLAFPGNALLQISTAQPDAALATILFTATGDNCGGVRREHIGPLSGIAPGHDTGNYLFLSAGPVAAGLASGNFTDIQRTAWTVTEAGGVRTCAAQNPVWEFRAFDDEKAPLPWVKVFVTGDLNGDGRATWQDAALVYRRTMPMPLGHEFVQDLVAENIAMNFASGAQQPFLQILDGIKRTWLATDGLGQQVVIKGFSSEGHDSANTDCSGHWNERAGGLRDFTYLLAKAPAYNARVGIHINASEAYPEAHRYDPAILQRNAAGQLKGGWSWLDQAHMIDKVKDVRSGQLFATLDAMRRDLPGLACVYVDTYWENGWPAAQTARKLQALGLPMYTEGDHALDPWTTWSHWRGGQNRIAEFIWFSDRDLNGNDAILRAGRADDDGFMGWQNRHDFNSHIRATFARRLPAKYLQHFELLRWDPGVSADFSGAVKVVKEGDRVTVTQGGDERMTWTGGGAGERLFVPWPPAQPAKIYVWDEVGGPKRWALPAAWRGADSLFLYRLTAEGRADEREVKTESGGVTIEVEKGVPFVLYPRRAAATPALEWGEGGPLRDPGFDSRGFTAWTRSPADAGTNAFKVEAGPRGDPRLMVGPDAGSVSQSIRGLQAGRTYAAAVWAQVTGTRLASIEVRCGGRTVSNYVTRTNVRHSAPNDPRTGSNYQRLAVWFDTPPGVSDATLVLRAGPGAPGSLVEFDAARVVPAVRSPESARHTFWEDFEDVPLGGYGPFTGCPGERTHLSEAHPPYTRDTISGRFSLKSRDGGRVLFTLPSTLRLKPLTRYRVSCDTMGAGHLAALSRGRTVMTLTFPNKADYAVGAITGEFATARDEESSLALYRDGGDFIAIDNFAVDELGPAPDVAEPAVTLSAPAAGQRVLLDESFEGPLSTNWTTIVSKQPGTQVAAEGGALVVTAAANTSALAERDLPAGAASVECILRNEGDQGETWGPGLCVLWPGGAMVRVNLRGIGGGFGVDSTAAAQQLVGHAAGDTVLLRIRWDGSQVYAETRSPEEADWQPLAQFPRAKFPGAPARIRIGKMHGVEGTDDHSAPGAEGSSRFERLCVTGG